ncbi:MAG: NAD(P)H-hydrate dehydratase, partial [Candidatus Methanofastidiosa archaeon]|nr:NAD(P)H-hydrate dehydratase [Candidatus Methanofastidiosa archaeon]
VIRSYSPPDDWNYDLIVDAILGTGIVGKVREPYLSYINRMNEAESSRLSVDIESGHGTDTKVNSDVVISLHESKQEGALVLPIGIPDQLTRLCGPGNVKFLERRPVTAHKGGGGSMAVIGGSEKYHGAPIYSSIAGSTICDLVYVICPKKVSGAIRCASPDIIVEETSSDRLDGSILDHPRIHEVDCILCGVGAGRSNATLDAFREFYQICKTPLIIDADGLHALKGHLDLLKSNMCITPHAREFASLFGELPADHAERKDVVGSLALEYDCTILLKGKIDIISSKGHTWENMTGNEGMTTGGTGDVLAGCTAAFAAKNPLFESALASSFVVGLAGDMVYANDDLFYTASDVLGMLPDALSFCNRF